MSTAKQTIDWYNKNAEKYVDHLRIEKASFHFLLEKPAMRALLPDIRGKTALSLACGPGDDTFYLKRTRKVLRAVGIDISVKLVEVAKKSFPACEFHVMNFEKLTFRDQEFDFLYSSLALNYSSDWKKVFNEAHRVLKPGCKFLFSIEHPMMTAVKKVRNKKERANLLGYRRDLITGRRQIYGDYLNARLTEGTMRGTVVYHRSLELIFKDILDAGFRISNLKEPKPLPDMSKIDPGATRTFSKFPIFLVIELTKPTS